MAVTSLNTHVREQIQLAEQERLRLGSSFQEIERKNYLYARLEALREILRLIKEGYSAS